MQKLTDLFIVPDIQQSAANINFTAPDGFKEVIWEIKDEEGRAVANPSFALKKNGNFLLSSKLQCHYFP